MTLTQTASIRLLKLLAFTCLALWVVEVVALSALPNKVFAGFRFEAPLDVSPINHPTWNGPKSGLIKDYDRILAVDGASVSTPEELEQVVRSKGAREGTPLRYTIWREGKTLDVTVRTQVMSVGSWIQSYLSILVPALLYLVVGMVAFWIQPQHRAAQVHLVMTCSVALFGVCANDVDSVRLFLWLFPFAIPLLGCTFLHLAWVFPDPGDAKRQGKGWLPYLPLLGLSLPWSFYFRAEGYGVNPARWDIHMTLYNLTNAWLGVGFLGLIGAMAWKAWRSETPIHRRQARIALAGAAGAFGPIVVTWLIPSFFLKGAGGTLGQAVYFSYLASVVFPASIAYAILRAQLFDIRVVIKRTAVYTITTVALLGVYFLLAATVRGWADILFQIKEGTGPLENLIATGVVAAAFNPLINWTRNQVDRLFDRGQYDLGECIEKFARLTDETLDPRQLFEHYFDLADVALHPAHASIFVRDAGGVFSFRAARNIAIPATYGVLSDRGELVELLNAESKGLLASRARTAPLVEGRIDWGFVLYIPLVWQGEVIGRVNFGPKRSDQPYAERDRQLLTSMAHRLADKLRIADMLEVAVAKARLDQELTTARAIHAAMLPAADPKVPQLQVASSSKAAFEFGGDYYDLVPLGDGRLAIAIGDVAGKGVQAAMVMAMTKAAFSTLVRTDPSVSKVMDGLNQMICDTIPDRTYRKTTFCYAILDPAAECLSYACAGHPPPIHFRVDSQTCESLAAPGAFPFGTNPKSCYEEHLIPFRRGEGLVFYTDGVTEARRSDGRAFCDFVRSADGSDSEIDELQRVIVTQVGSSANDIKEAILRRLREFTGKTDVSDDVTLVVIRNSPSH